MDREGLLVKNDHISAHLIRAQLARMLRSEVFRKRRGSSQLLRFLVEESLRSGFAAIGQRELAVHALGLADDFSPQKSAHVRVAVGRLRSALHAYYTTQGMDDPVIFDVASAPYRLGAQADAAARQPSVGADPRGSADRPSRRGLPALLVMQPDCHGHARTLDSDVGLRLMSDLLFSTMTTASGPLRRASVPSGLLPAEFAAELGFDYVADGRGPRARLEVMATDGSGMVLAAETEWPDLDDCDRASREIATWLCHRIGMALSSVDDNADGRVHAQDRGHRKADADDSADVDHDAP